MDWLVVPARKPILGQQSGPFQLENCQGLCQSLLDADFNDNFTAGFLNSGRKNKHDISGDFFIILVVFCL
jgi:hypothetical protein